MKIWLFLLLSFLSLSVQAQQTPYQHFEVDSAAEPRGGMAYLTTFIQANLRKPIAAEAAGTGGIVIVGGTVEPDGRIADVAVMKGLRPDCDREAARVFKLFNAWKPAQKGNKAVQQRVSIPVKFNQNASYLYRDGAQITFFDKKQKPVTDSSLAAYKQTTPLDSIGLPAGNVVIYEKKRNQWEVVSTVPFVRKTNTPQETSDFYQQATYSIGYPSSIYRYDGQLANVDEAGRLLRRAYFQTGKRVGAEYIYYLNGCVAERIEEIDNQINYTDWYPNGQIKQLKTLAKAEPGKASQPEQVSAYWDSTGTQIVKNGFGHVVYQLLAPSKVVSSHQTQLTEQGSYANGLKQGIWMGVYADGSYFYEEQYDKGVCQIGKAKSTEGDTTRYTVVQQSPEFVGGLPALQRFLAENLRYPPDAQRAGVQGRVFVSFLVDTDGALRDYQIIRGASPDLDEEAVRVVKASNGHWKPAFQRGQRVQIRFNLPINFALQ